MTWVDVCAYEQMQPERGLAALVDGVQVALFRLHDGQLFAIGNQDPVAGANVMSRGIVGTRGDAPTVASPIYKESYDLRTGECLDKPGVRVLTYRVRCQDGIVQVDTAAPNAATGNTAAGETAAGETAAGSLATGDTSATPVAAEAP